MLVSAQSHECTRRPGTRGCSLPCLPGSAPRSSRASTTEGCLPRTTASCRGGRLRYGPGMPGQLGSAPFSRTSVESSAALPFVTAESRPRQSFFASGERRGSCIFFGRTLTGCFSGGGTGGLDESDTSSWHWASPSALATHDGLGGLSAVTTPSIQPKHKIANRVETRTTRPRYFMAPSGQRRTRRHD